MEEGPSEKFPRRLGKMSPGKGAAEKVALIPCKEKNNSLIFID